MKDVFDEYGTRILGYVIALLGAVGALATTGAFAGLLDDSAIRWVGIVASVSTTVFGGATVVRGASNAAQIKVATALETAIKATPGEST
jgi:hypothetical protein